MVGFLPFGLLSAASFHLVRAVPAEPADPTITAPAVLPLRPRQQDAAFIGYLSSGGSWVSEDCNSGLTWYEEGGYGQCCPTTLSSCPAATACISGSQIYPFDTTTITIACTENYGDAIYSVCNTILIFENTLDSSPKTNINCGNKNVRWSYYRSIDTAAAATSTRDSNSDSDSDAGILTGTGASRPAATDDSSPAATDDSSPAEPEKKKSSSKAWIAGAVVGPILGLALIGLVAFCLLRRKKKNKPSTLPPQTGTVMAPAPNPSQPPAGVAGYTDTKPQFAAQHQSYYDQGPLQQQAYPQQGGFGGDVSPATQYATPAPVPYGAPSPPPQQQQPAGVGMGGQPVYGSPNPNDTKMAHMHAPAPGTSELGGESAPHSPAGRPVSYAPPPQQQGSPAPVYGAELQGSAVR